MFLKLITFALVAGLDLIDLILNIYILRKYVLLYHSINITLSNVNTLKTDGTFFLLSQYSGCVIASARGLPWRLQVRSWPHLCMTCSCISSSNTCYRVSNGKHWQHPFNQGSGVDQPTTGCHRFEARKWNFQAEGGAADFFSFFFFFFFSSSADSMLPSDEAVQFYTFLQTEVYMNRYFSAFLPKRTRCIIDVVKVKTTTKQRLTKGNSAARQKRWSLRECWLAWKWACSHTCY